MGLREEGDAINRGSCDFLNAPNPTQRLCWHTSGGNVTGGYRSGSNNGLNESTAYRRAIYVASDAVASSESRAGYCLGGRFLDLVSDQPTSDGAYFGATPAIFVAGLGATCDPPPPGYVRSGFAGEERHVRAGLHPLYLPQP